MTTATATAGTASGGNGTGSSPGAPADRVVIFDTTLRDGEQAPGCSMTQPEKLRVARALAELGVDVIEAGFPAASRGDWESVNAVAREVREPIIAGLARCTREDIELAARALAPAGRRRLHVFLATSAIHRQYKLNMAQEQIISRAVEGVKIAREYCDDVEFSPEDASRTELDFLAQVVQAAIEAGATTINIPDTVGYTTPQEYIEMIRMLRESVPGAENVVFSTHCHNDLGLAVANSLAGVIAGARQVECTINGIGERAGNAALEEIVMALKVRRDAMPFTTGIDTTMLARASKLVSNVTGFPVQFNKAIVGKNAFAHESGIHQDGMLKNVETYEIMRPEEVGVHATSLVLGKLSGRHAFRDKLGALGYELSDAAVQEAFKRFKELADKKKHVFDEDIIALVDDEIVRHADVIVIKSLKVETGIGIAPTADMALVVDSQERHAKTSGDGPIDAIFKAIREIYPHTAALQQFQVQAVTEGTDAQATVSVRLEENGRTVTGRGADTDTLVAAAHAYVTALNKLLVKREKQVPEALTVAR